MNRRDAKTASVGAALGAVALMSVQAAIDRGRDNVKANAGETKLASSIPATYTTDGAGDGHAIRSDAEHSDLAGSPPRSG